jgi:Holliday junction resolvase RusA-like endonuclease
MNSRIAREIVLPWPERVLHPNARPHWSVKRKAVKLARHAAYILAYDAGWKPETPWPEGPLHIWIDGYPKDRRRRDADGLLSSLKAALDGIADAMGVDDRRFVPHPWVKDEVRKGGEVRIRITGGPV